MEKNNSRNGTKAGNRTKKIVIPVVEEEAVISKQVVETGKVRVSKRVSEHEELIDEPILREEVSVERVPVNVYVEAPPAVRYEGDLMIVPVIQEQIVMQKRLVLVEEIRIRKEVVEIHQPQTVRVRKERVDVRRVAGKKRTGS